MGILIARRRRPGRALAAAALVLALLSPAGTTAQQPERFDERVRTHFFAGFGGDADALRRGMAIAAATLATEPHHPQASVWQAAGWLFQAGLAFERGDADMGMTLFQESLTQFERAVSASPDDVAVRIPRATSFAASARFVAHQPTRDMMLETALGDYLKVLELQEPFLEALSIHSRGELLGGIADVLWQLGRRDDAALLLRRVIAALPGSSYAIAAQRQLDRPQATVRLTCHGCHK